MKKLLTTLFLASAMMVAFASDKIFLHGGKTIDGKVVKVDDFKIIYKYEGEDAEQTVTKKAVEKIQYSSGRTGEAVFLCVFVQLSRASARRSS